MKGLLIKDFYIIKSVLAIMCVVFLVIGASLSYLATPWVLTVLATVMLGMMVTTTINVDRSSGWMKTAFTTPVSRKTVIGSKYMMYLLLSAAGLLFGLVFGSAATAVLGGDMRSAGLYICISVTMALLSGSVILPVCFLLDDGKSILGNIFAYPLSAGIFVAFSLIMGEGAATLGVLIGIAVCIFAASWFLAGKVLAKKDIL